MQTLVTWRPTHLKCMLTINVPNNAVLKRRLTLWIVFSVLSYILSSLCSPTLSWFSNYNGHSLDQNVYHLIGKYWMEGAIPYKDFGDLKGPLLYLIYGLASLITPLSFAALRLFHSLLIGVGMLFAYESLKLFLPAKWAVPAFLTYLSYTVPFGGNPSEYVWAMQHIVWYFVLCYLKDGGKPFRYPALITTGFCVGATICLKYNLIITFFPSCVLMLFCSRYKWYQSLQFLSIGCLSILLPFVIYFHSNGALADLVEEYFLTAIKYGGVPMEQSAICTSNIKLLQEFLPFKYEMLPSALLTASGSIVLVLSLIPFSARQTFQIKRTGIILHLSSIILTSVVLYMGPHKWSHYAFSLHPFLITAFAGVFKFIELRIHPPFLRHGLVCCGLSIPLLMVLLFTHRSMKYSKYASTAGVKSVAAHIGNSTFITDGTTNIILYRLTNTRPPIKHFVPQYIKGGMELHYNEIHAHISTTQPEYLIMSDTRANTLIPRLFKHGLSYTKCPTSESIGVYKKN